MRAILSALFLLLAGDAVAQQQATGEKIVFAMDWKAQPEQGGFFQALASGLYRQRGLDVELRSGGAGLDNQQLIAAGAVDMALGSNVFMVLNLARVNAPAVAVMASFQKDPQVLIAHPDSPVQNLADLKGRPIMLSDSSINSLFVWLKTTYGLEDRQIRKYSGNLAPFLADKTAITQGYASSEPFQVQRVGGFTPKVWLLADHGYAGYAAMVLVRRDWVTSKPDIVQKFVDATIEGWEAYLYGDSSAADALIRQRNPDITEPLIEFAKTEMRNRHLVREEAGKADVGRMTEQRWQQIFDSAAAMGLYPRDMDWRRAFTLQFLRPAAR